MPIRYPDAEQADAPDVGISLDTVEREVLAGLPAHADRLTCAWDNEQYYQGRNASYIARKESEEYNDFLRRPKPTSKLTRKAVRELTKQLYSPGPTRALEGAPAADAWLAQVYTANHVNSVMQSADRAATLNATSAVMATATGLPEKPVKLDVYGAHQYVIFPHPNDHTTPFAVCTIEKVHEGDKVRLRLELWSRDEHRVYLSKEQDQNCAWRDLFGMKCQFVPQFSGMPAGSGVNPYGCLPFCFVHDEPPVSSFWEGGLGTMLRELNAEADAKYSQLSNLIDKYLDPDGFLRNVSTQFRREKRPGGWQHLPPGRDSEGEAAGDPDAFYVQPQLEVEQALTYIRTRVNDGFEELDVPLTAVRADASAELSGIAIVAKSQPLRDRTKARQVHFTPAETDLARLCLCVAGNYYGIPELLAAAADPKLTLLWPEPQDRKSVV